jgi:hypothetical protein
MLIRKLRDDSIKRKDNVLDVIPEKKKYCIRDKNEEIFIKKIIYNTNDMASPDRSDSSNIKKYNLTRRIRNSE